MDEYRMRLSDIRERVENRNTYYWTGDTLWLLKQLADRDRQIAEWEVSAGEAIGSAEDDHWKIKRLEQQNTVMRETLNWYADPYAYMKQPYPGGSWGAPSDADGGQRARETLGKVGVTKGADERLNQQEMDAQRLAAYEVYVLLLLNAINELYDASEQMMTLQKMSESPEFKAERRAQKMRAIIDTDIAQCKYLRVVNGENIGCLDDDEEPEDRESLMNAINSLRSILGIDSHPGSKGSVTEGGEDE